MELTINVKSQADIAILIPLFERMGIAISGLDKKMKNNKVKNNVLPITYAKKADFMQAAGIWKDKDIDPEVLRREAWGNRL